MKIFYDDGNQYTVPDDVYDKLIALQKEREYLDKRQYSLKITMNALYGALSNKHFRYFDPRLGNSTTGTGRLVLDHITKKVGEYFDGTYTYPSPSSIYGDTDSSYFSTGADNVDEAVVRADSFAKVCTASMTPFMQDMFLCKGKFTGLIKVAREVVATKGIFVAKKLYMLHVIDKKGKRTDDIKVMGLLLKKTLIPKHISQQISDIFEVLLVGGDWTIFNDKVMVLRETIAQSGDVRLLGLPKTVKDFETYRHRVDSYNKKDRIPGHVRAAANYNRALKRFNDINNQPIVSGTKIKLYYLKTKDGTDTSIALPTDINEIPEWFMEYYWPKISIPAQILRLVDNPIKQVLKAVGKNIPTRDDLVVAECLIF